MRAVQCSARVPKVVDHERTVWAPVELDTIRIGRQTVLFIRVWGPQGWVTLATCHLNEIEVVELMRKLVR